MSAFADLIPTTAQRPPMRISGAPKAPAPQTASQAQNDILGVRVKEAELGDRPLNREVKQQNLRQGDMQMAGALRDDYDTRQTVKDYKAALPIYADALKTPHTPQGDLSLIYAFAKVMDPGSVVREGEQATAANTQPLIDKYAAQFDKQFRAGGTLTEEGRNNMRKALASRMASLNEAFIGERVRFKGIADRNGINPMDVVGEHPGGRFQDTESAFLGRPVSQADYQGNIIPTVPPEPPTVSGTPSDPLAQGPRLTPEQNAKYDAFMRANPNATATEINAFAQGMGMSVANADAVAKARQQGRFIPAAGADYSLADEQAQAAARAEKERIDAEQGKAGAAELAFNGAMINQADRIDGLIGGAGAILSGKDPIAAYQVSRDASRLRMKEARQGAGGWAIPAEVAGGLLTGGIAGKAGGVLAKDATMLERAYSAGKVSAVGGGIAGSNSGGTIRDDIGGAFTGAAIGGGVGALTAPLGAGIGAAYNKYANRSGAIAAREARAAAQPVIDAGISEAVPVSRAMVDPSLANKLTATEASIAGGPTVRKGLDATYRAINEGVDRLGGAGTALEPQVAGQSVRDAAERYIKTSGAVARRSYDKVEKLAAGVKVAPAQSVQQIDGVLSKLSETPEINAGEIAFLSKLKADMGKDLSVGGLRRIRTSLRGKISKGELTFGEDEANVLGIMDAASQDIEAGLRAQGKESAADAFRTADTAYRQRMQFIGDQVQKLIGKRGQNVTPEATFSRFQAMATPKGDNAGLGKMLAVMEPEERADIAATLAASLGRNAKGEFSTAFLVSQAAKMPAAARLKVFGEDGARSLNNLITLAKAHSDTLGKLNNSRSGVATVGNAYRSALATIAGVVTGTGSSNVAGGIAATAATVGGVAAKDILSARALMSTNLTKWMAQAPKSEAAIQAHIGRLSAVASREPAISGEVMALQQRLYDAFGQSPQRLAAAPTTGNEEKK